MTDYDESIHTIHFKYFKEITYTNETSTSKHGAILKLLLNRNNFNFDLPKSDGSDFRLLSFGGTLKMWIAYWSKEAQRAVLFFKVPIIGAYRSYTFQAYWGNEDAESISNPEPMGFLFYEKFDTTPLDSDKWAGRLVNAVTPYGYYLYHDGYPFVTTTNPLEGLTSFRLEMGVYGDWNASGWYSDYAAMFVGVEGTENDFRVGIADTNQSKSNAVNNEATAWFTKTATYGGLEANSYQEVIVVYKEPEDRVYLELINRDSFEDYQTSWPRKVEGDTRPNNIRLQGYQSSNAGSGPHPTYINWLAVREYDEESPGLIDGSNLFIPYENVPAQPTDRREYGDDLTSILFSHESSFGGDPYKLSINSYDSNDNIWISDEDAILEDYVVLDIHMGWSEDVAASKYIHYDSGHEEHYAAVRLSDDDETPFGWTFMHLTTSSGFAAIKFKTSTHIGAFRVKSTSNLDACPKDFIFYGSVYNPIINYEEARELIRGTFGQTEDWQSRVLLQGHRYRYYILEILNTYGGDNVEVQEWELMESLDQKERRYPTQLRLHPAIHGDLQYNFPKEISLVGSNDGITWDTLIPWTDTYTPFVVHNVEYGLWQRYSFNNNNGYWSFRLLCKGNWRAQDNKIAIGEWELRELATEEYTYHILAGSTNDIQQIWANEGCTLDDPDTTFFVATDYVSRIADNRVVGREIMPPYYEDINVIQETF